MLEKAIKISVKAHEGQVDKAGNPYILHPLRVMMDCESNIEKVCAVLHDVIEDTAITFDDLKDEGFSNEVLEILDCLTKKSDENYGLYIERVCKNEIACKIKLADLKDNMDLSRIENPGIEDERRMDKYMDAFEKIYFFLHPDREGIENYYEIEINGCVILPKLVSIDKFNDEFISFIERNHWYFGGGVNILEENV